MLLLIWPYGKLPQSFGSFQNFDSNTGCLSVLRKAVGKHPQAPDHIRKMQHSNTVWLHWKRSEEKAMFPSAFWTSHVARFLPLPISLVYKSKILTVYTPFESLEGFSYSRVLNFMWLCVFWGKFLSFLWFSETIKNAHRSSVSWVNKTSSPGSPERWKTTCNLCDFTF